MPVPLDAELSSGELARELGVTAMTIRNWRDSGILTPCGTRDHLGRQIDVYRFGEARKAAAQRRQGTHGGRRRKAGRKSRKRTGPLENAFVAAEDKRDAAEQVAGDLLRIWQIDTTAEEAVEAAARLGRLRYDEIATISARNLELLASLGQVVGLSPEKVKTLSDLTNVRIGNLKAAQIEGTLVDARETETELKGMLQTFRRRLETMSQQAAPAIADAMGLDRSEIPAIRGVIDEFVHGVLETLSREPV